VLGGEGTGPSRGRWRGESVKQRGVLTNVDAKGVRGPTSKRLYAVVRPPAGGEKRGTTGAERVPTKSGRKKAMKACEEPRPSGNGTERVKPEVGVETRETVTASEIGSENRNRIKWS
jgi:hypothetical protein